MTANRVGEWSARAVVGIGGAYLLILTAGMVRFGFRVPISGALLTIMEGLTLLSAPPVVALVAALGERAGPAHRLVGRLALVCAGLFAGTTMAVHFVRLTSGRQLAGGSSLVWPSTAYALELLAWDVFLGLALVLAATTMEVAEAETADRTLAARRALMWCGALCLVGTVGPVLGTMQLQLVGVFGYAVVLPMAAVLLGRVFGAERLLRLAAAACA